MSNGQAVAFFKERHPTLKIRPDVVNGTLPFSIDIRPRDERNAIPGSIADCTIARAVHRHRKSTSVDEAIHKTVAYLLEPVGNSGYFQVVKYRHDGAAIAQRLDEGSGNQSNQIVRFSPPSGDRAVGAKHERTTGRKPPSRESIELGVATRRRNREAAISLRTFVS
jgi:hypothetical protein